MTQPMAAPQQEPDGSFDPSDAAAPGAPSIAAAKLSKGGGGSGGGGAGGEPATARSLLTTRSLLSMSYGDLLPARCARVRGWQGQCVCQGLCTFAAGDLRSGLLLVGVLPLG